jgi:hypothetical protein
VGLCGLAEAGCDKRQLGMNARMKAALNSPCVLQVVNMIAFE